MALELNVVTPTQDALRVSCDEVVVPGIAGELGVLPGHVPFISALRPGTMSILREGKRTVACISSGFVEVDQDRVTVLTDAYEPAANIDVERARKALTGAEEKLRTLGPEDPGYTEAERRAARAQARLDAAARQS
jgi:F-type H+-transporting ATPase subunit epsilon